MVEPSKNEVFLQEVAAVINRLSLENGSNTPDYILAAYLWDCLTAFNEGVYQRSKWYGRQDSPGGDIACSALETGDDHGR